MALAIAFVVAFCIGLLIGLTASSNRVRVLELQHDTDRKIIAMQRAQREYCYTVEFVHNRLAVYADRWCWEQLTKWQQQDLKRQAARILGKRVKSEDSDLSIPQE